MTLPPHQRSSLLRGRGSSIATLVALATLVAPGCAVDLGGTPGGPADTIMTDAERVEDRAFAEDFLADLTLGMNIERGYAAGAKVNDPAYWGYLRGLGITHVRLFYPWRPGKEMGGGGPGNSVPDAAKLAPMMDAIDGAVDAGLKVFFDCSDVIEKLEVVDGVMGPRLDGHIELCAKVLAQRGFDPHLVAVGPVNELAGQDNGFWNSHRARWHGVMRKHLPDHVLLTGAANWKGPDQLMDASFQLFDDRRVIYDWHAYETRDAAGWKKVTDRMFDWMKANGWRPMFGGEVGPTSWCEWSADGKCLKEISQDNWAWPARYATMLPVLAWQRPTLWAVSDGDSFRHSKSRSDPYLMDGSNGQGNLEAAVQQAAAAMSKIIEGG